MNDDNQIIGQEAQVEQSSQPDEAQVSGAEQVSDEPSMGLPESVADRTKREFEKLKENNRKLKEELEGYRTQDYQPSRPVVENFVDDEGNVDITTLNKSLKEANERAYRAEQIALETKKDREKKMVAEAHQKHPYLDPDNDSFDSQFYDLVRDRLIRNYSEGREKDITVVADEIAKIYKPTKAVVENKNETAKANVNQSVSKRVQTDDLDDLRRRTVQGDAEALRERIRNL